MKDNAASPLLAEDDPQARPVVVSVPGDGPDCLLKIDLAARLGEVIVVAGWCSGPEPEFSLYQGPDKLKTDIQRTLRPDVAGALCLPGTERLGFVLMAETGQGDSSLVVSNAAGESRFGLTVSEDLPEASLGMIQPAVAAQLALLVPGATRWCKFLPLLPDGTAVNVGLLGCIDHAYAAPGKADSQGRGPGFGWCSGWISPAPDTQVWLEDDAGGVHGLAEAYTWVRDDIRQNVNECYSSGGRSGFLSRIAPNPGASSIRLCAAGSGTVCRLPPVPIGQMAADPIRATTQILAVISPLQELPERARRIDLPVLGALRRRQIARWAGRTPRQGDVGPQPQKTPRASIIIPLYGRADFIEHQLLEFRRDADFAPGPGGRADGNQQVELIYVIDDPGIESFVCSQAGYYQRLCGPAFRWISAGENRGYAAANMLGASIARADRLIFLNSDVFPVRPGWVGGLCDILDARPRIGMVGPRLLFPEGGLQHAGMVPHWNDTLQLWTNRHPFMGLDPELDPAQGPKRVPLLTGACMAVRRGDFDRAGGWNCDYLAGDFEDSDLCLRIAALGLGLWYQSDVELIHLERQSFDRIGENSLRQRLTLLNAVRYNMRWSKELGPGPGARQ